MHLSHIGMGGSWFGVSNCSKGEFLERNSGTVRFIRRTISGMRTARDSSSRASTAPEASS